MPKRDPPIQERYSADVIIAGCRNIIEIDDETLDSLANGICPEALAERMWRLKSLEREGARQAARKKNEKNDAARVDGERLCGGQDLPRETSIGDT